MTIEELKAKYKDDNDLIKTIDELQSQVNKNYLEDNVKLLKENEKLKNDNLLLYNQVMNKGGRSEDENEGDPLFKDYSEQIIEELRNIKK